MWIINLLTTCITSCLRTYRALGLALLLAAFLTCLGPTLDVSAKTVSTCRGDPIVLLSNHLLVQLEVEVDQPDASHVDHVVYTLHGPVGVSALSVLELKSPFFGKEQFVYIADQQSNHYIVDTILYSKAKMNVTAYSSMLDGVGSLLSSVASGLPNQHIMTEAHLKDTNQNNDNQNNDNQNNDG